MQAFAGISILLLIIVSTGIGVRLIRVWQRTRQLPELYLGLSLISIMVLGYPLFIVSRASDAIGFHAAWATLVLGSVFTGLGFWLQYLFTWKTFRPESRLCLGFIAAVACGFAVNVVSLAIAAWTSGSAQMDMGQMPLWHVMCSLAVNDLVYMWTAFESLRYYGTLRKRQSLGLVEPVVTNRLLLWGQMSIVSLTVIVLNQVVSIMRVDVLATPWILAFTSLGGISQAVYLLLIFLPPQGYREWVEREAAEEGA